MALASPFRPPTVGLDIGSSAVKAVVLKKGRSGWSLVAAGETPLPERHAQETGAAVEPEAVSGAVSQLFDAIRLRRARVATALSGHAVIVKRLSMPTMTEAELGEAIPWEAEQYIPFDLSEVQLDYQIVSSRGENKSGLDVLLVAAKRDRIDERARLIAGTGRRPVVLDVEAFALSNAYQANYPDRDDALAALIHIGRRVTIVCLLEHGEPIFTRDINIGGQAHIDALLSDLGPMGVDEMTAKRILHGQFPHDLDPDQIASVLREASAHLVNEVRKTVDFYRATAPVEKLARVVVSGGAWQAVGLVDQLASEFAAPVDIFDPFRKITRPSRAIGADLAGPAYAVAVGLAMREEGDR